MKSNITKKIAVLLLVCMLAVLPAAVQVSAANVPKAVLDSRSGVLRIISVMEEGVSSGTGFVVGTEDDKYIVTNHHVVDGGVLLYAFYDTGKYVPATVYAEDIARDISILKLEEDIPDLPILPLESGAIDSGMAVFALGFPGASDTLAKGFTPSRANSKEEFLASVVADDRSMTVTNGIISALRYSSLVGNATQQVKLIQTNTAINRGNSGGPLVNTKGHVVGVNTLGITGIEWHIEAMNGSVYIQELVTVLERENIAFLVADAGSKQMQNLYSLSQILKISALVLVALLALAVIIMLYKNFYKKTGGISGGHTMSEFEYAQKARPEHKVREMLADFTAYLLKLEKTTAIESLLSPDNIIIGNDKIKLVRKKSWRKSANTLELYPGYSPAESYTGSLTPASNVYFIGSLGYLLMTGRRPPDAMQRSSNDKTLFHDRESYMPQLIENAMSVKASERISSLAELYTQLAIAPPANNN